MNKWIVLILAVTFFGFLSLLDLGINIIGLIPGLGDWAESFGEAILEAIQFLMYAITGYFAIVLGGEK